MSNPRTEEENDGHRKTRLLGMTHVYEGGCMMVRARDDIYRMKDLKGKRVGLSKSLNTILPWTHEIDPERMMLPRSR